ncbi:hypothetical protein [Streptomyces sp. CoH27]|uniref:hypothetical protein n=1 Tax=Streptomyces sp. CoH27 TaxID=2875763 RepID=UPI001CD31449|nr:hypothetical protein [Streptomyces sp. CoH27]
MPGRALTYVPAASMGVLALLIAGSPAQAAKVAQVTITNATQFAGTPPPWSRPTAAE